MTDRQTDTAQTDVRSGWLYEAARDGSVIVKARSHSHSCALTLLLFLQQTNKSTTTMAEKQKQATKRVEGFQKSLSVGGVWVSRAS